MHDSNHYRLLFGPYFTPRFEYGDFVFCERFVEVKIGGLADASIPWPFTKRGGRPSIILFAGLAEAVKRESNIAICHWWGVTPQTVSKWRKALEIPHATEGTSRLHSVNAQEEPVIQGRMKAVAKARDPERRRKIAEAKRGKPRPKSVMEKVRAANIGRPLSAEHRAKISEASRRNGTISPKAGRPWTAAEDKAVRTLSAEEAAAKTGRTLMAIYNRRNRLGVPDARTQEQKKASMNLGRCL